MNDLYFLLVEGLNSDIKISLLNEVLNLEKELNNFLTEVKNIHKTNTPDKAVDYVIDYLYMQKANTSNNCLKH